MVRAGYLDVMKGCKFSEPPLLVLVTYVDTLSKSSSLDPRKYPDSSVFSLLEMEQLLLSIYPCSIA